jgi:hypothetical protein
MLLVATVSAILNIPRTFDLSGVYGRVSFDAGNFLHNTVSALHLLCLNVFIMSTARALYLQLQKPIPTFFIVALMGSNTFYFLSIVILNSLTITSNHDRDYLNFIWALKGLAFDATMMLIMGQETNAARTAMAYAQWLFLFLVSSLFVVLLCPFFLCRDQHHSVRAFVSSPGHVHCDD